MRAPDLAVWVVDPRERTVTVHGQSPPSALVYGEADVLPCGELLPGLELAVRDVFA